MPAEVADHLEQLRDFGSANGGGVNRPVVLVFVTHPETAATLFRDQSETLTDPTLRQMFLDYDRVHDLDSNGPRVDDLARRIVDATADRYGPDDFWTGRHLGDRGADPRSRQRLVSGVAADRHGDPIASRRLTSGHSLRHAQR